MPINLDSCIAGIFIPGNIGASSGQTPVERVVPSFEVGNYGAGTARGVGTAHGDTGTFSTIGTAAGTGAASAVGGTAIWTPADLGSALRAWFQMDLLSGSNGSTQSSVTDSSGNSRTMTAVTAATLAAADLNSKNTLRFTGSSSQRYSIPSATLSGSSAASMYLVFKVVSVSATNGLCNLGGTGNDAFPFSNGQYYEDFGSTARKDNMTVTGSAATAYRIISIYSAASDWAMYMDGGTGGSGGGTTAAFSTGTNTVGFPGGTYLIGANAGLAGLDGWIAEVVLTNAKQSTTDRQKVEGYLAHKWALLGNLAASHPHKTTPP